MFAAAQYCRRVVDGKPPAKAGTERNSPWPRPRSLRSEIHVNTTTVDDQDTPSVTALANGKFVVVWEDFSETGGDLQFNAVRAQLYNADGSPSGSEFLVNQTTVNAQDDPVVAGLADGRFVVAWRDQSKTGDDTSGAAIRARIFDVHGAPAGDEFLVNTVTNDDQFDPAIAALTTGGFVVTWTRKFSANDLDIRGRAFDAAGTPLGSDFPIDTSGVNDETELAVVGLANGNYAVVWEDEGSVIGQTDGSGSHIRGVILSGNGAVVVPQFIVNATAPDRQAGPSLALLSNGNFVVSWGSGNFADGGILGRVFSPSGVALGPDFVIDDETDREIDPAVSGLANGAYAVAWESFSLDPEIDGSASHVRGELFAGGAGVGISDEFVVNTTASGSQGKVTLTTLADGRLVAAWTDFGGNLGDSGSGVRAQIFDPRTERVNLAGTGLDDDWVGTVFGDIMNGGAGNDSLAGGLGGDLLFGAEGDDRLDGGAGNDLLNGFRGADRMIGGDGNDSYIVDDAGDLIIEEASDGVDGVFSSISLALPDNVEKLELDNFDDAVNATGNAIANILIGNAAANVLDGGAGADRMTGGLGDDTYVVDDPGDAVLEDVDAGIDAVLSSVAFALGAEVENLTLTGLAAIDGIGNALANVMIGNDAGNVLSAAAGNDVVDGGFGADAMAGGLGDDVYVVDQTGDVVFEASGEGFDAVFSAVAFTLGANLENLTLTGAANAAAKASAGGVNGTGNAGANTIVGSLSGNRLDGGAGNDALIGQAGRDALLGGKGNDLLGGGLGKDLLAGGKGKDQFLFDSDLTSQFR